MPKLKTRRSVAKRFRLTKRGRVKRAMAGKGHILTKKSRKRKRKLVHGAFVSSAEEKIIRKMLPYG